MNYDRYNIFPPLSQHLGETYGYYDSAASEMKMIEEFYDSYGYIPFLRIGERDKSWALWFYLSYLPEGSIPITLSLKSTSHHPIRNADPTVWLSFIDRCKIAFPEIMFVVVGLREEVFDGLKDRQNVVIAKDYGTSIMEDLALIRSSLAYMCTTSGVNAIAMFSDTPYLQFQFPNMEQYGLDEGTKFSFAADNQKIFSTNIDVTSELLLQEFTELYLKLDQNCWHDTMLKNARNKSTHPSAVGLQSTTGK